MTTDSAARWVLVQRADAPDDDRDRVDELARVLGSAATVRRTAGPDDLDPILHGLGGAIPVICGGDGSIHLAVNRLYAFGRLAETPVALFPAGTGNDLSRTLALPDTAAEMAELLQVDQRLSMDLLDLGEHGVAVNAVHAGIGVDAAQRRTARWGRWRIPWGRCWRV